MLKAHCYISVFYWHWWVIHSMQQWTWVSPQCFGLWTFISWKLNTNTYNPIISTGNHNYNDVINRPTTIFSWWRWTKKITRTLCIYGVSVRTLNGFVTHWVSRQSSNHHIHSDGPCSCKEPAARRQEGRAWYVKFMWGLWTNWYWQNPAEESDSGSSHMELGLQD